jgi:hypothetical protein
MTPIVRALSDHRDRSRWSVDISLCSRQSSALLIAAAPRAPNGLTHRSRSRQGLQTQMADRAPLQGMEVLCKSPQIRHGQVTHRRGPDLGKPAAATIKRAITHATENAWPRSTRTTLRAQALLRDCLAVSKSMATNALGRQPSRSCCSSGTGFFLRRLTFLVATTDADHGGRMSLGDQFLDRTGSTAPRRAGQNR